MIDIYNLVKKPSEKEAPKEQKPTPQTKEIHHTDPDPDFCIFFSLYSLYSFF